MEDGGKRGMAGTFAGRRHSITHITYHRIAPPARRAWRGRRCPRAPPSLIVSTGERCRETGCKRMRGADRTTYAKLTAGTSVRRKMARALTPASFPGPRADAVPAPRPRVSVDVANRADRSLRFQKQNTFANTFLSHSRFFFLILKN